MASEKSSVVVCDAGPLIHLDELKCLDLLADYSQILVPEVVWAEVWCHRPSALRRRRVALTHVTSIPEPTGELARLLEATPLDPGEEQALRLMTQLRDATLLTDDSTARLVAEGMCFSVHGTLGVMLQGRLRGRRTKRQLLGLLRAVPLRSTLHASKQLLSGLIAQVQAEDS